VSTRPRSGAFGNGREQVRQQSATEKDELQKQIGQLTLELD
jgi:hypothetical protein